MDSQSKSQTQLKAAVCVNKEQGKRKREWRSKDRLVKISDATQGCHCVWEKPYCWVIGRNLYDCMHKHNLSSTVLLAFRDQLAQ